MPWKRGQVTNRNGPKKETATVRLAKMKLRELTPLVASKMEEMLNTVTDPKMLLAVCSKILEFTMAKPTERVRVSVRDQVRKWSDEELLDEARRISRAHFGGDDERPS